MATSAATAAPHAVNGRGYAHQASQLAAAVESSTTQLSGTRSGVRMQLHRSSDAQGSPPLSWLEVLRMWQEDTTFSSNFSEQLAKVELQDFFWEAAPTSRQFAASQPFECVLLDARGSLTNRQVSHRDFDEHFERNKGPASVVRFPNLGRDATLVVPMQHQGAGLEAYGSLASFVRHAAPQQQAELWSTVSREMQRGLEQSPGQPLWLNTEGSGVPWLHIRLDTRPKYVKFSEYRSWRAGV
jgi:hypothetical protein